MLVIPSIFCCFLKKKSKYWSWALHFLPGFSVSTGRAGEGPGLTWGHPEAEPGDAEQGKCGEPQPKALLGHAKAILQGWGQGMAEWKGP